MSTAIFNGPRTPDLLDWNIANLLDVQASRHGDSLAVVSRHQNARQTYSDLRDRVRRLALCLVQNGVVPGQRLVLLAGNCTESVEIFLATAAIGAISVLMAPTLSNNEFIDAVQSVGKFKAK